MRFLFVDKISKMEDKKIWGERFFSPEDPLRYHETNVIASGIVSEAIGQLVSWLTLKQNNFTKRPVFLFADEINIHREVPLGHTVKLEAWIDAQDNESFTFSGRAMIGEEVFQEIKNCNGYFMNLDEMEDSNICKSRFESLISEGGLNLDGHLTSEYDFNRLLGQVSHLEQNKQIKVKHKLSIEEPFYRDHFPKFPVTPIVMINEMIGRTTGLLLGDEFKNKLVAKQVKDIKIKNFIKPEEEFEISVSILDRNENEIFTMAEITKEGRKILRGRYVYTMKEIA